MSNSTLVRLRACMLVLQLGHIRRGIIDLQKGGKGCAPREREGRGRLSGSQPVAQRNQVANS